jgi:hypothetical protein
VSDLQLLFLVLALLYGWECACWVTRGSVAFRSWLGRRWRVLLPGTLLGNQRGGFIFAHPVPPLGMLLTGNQLPLSLSPESLAVSEANALDAAAEPRDQSANPIAWTQVQRIEARGKKIMVNSHLLVKVSSPLRAVKTVQLLRRLSQAAPAEREKLIGQTLGEQFDCTQIEQQWHEFKNRSGGLRLATNALFLYLFVVSPIVIWWIGLGRCWIALLAGLIGLTGTIAALFHRVHKKLYATAEDERFSHFVILLLSPATAIRALDVISRPLLEDFHPLAIAKVFCPAGRFEGLAEKYLRELRYQSIPGNSQQDSIGRKAQRYWREVSQKTLEDFLNRSGVDTKAFLQAPAASDDTCLSYCPRCLAQFTTREGVCADCGGVRLAPFRSQQRR